MLRRLGKVGLNLLFVAMLGCAAIMIVPSLLGYQRYIILTGSMTGTYDRGSIVFDKPVPTASLKVGDPISYNPPPGFTSQGRETHRIYRITTGKDGVRTYQTKGDANKAPDVWHFQLPRPTQDEVKFSIPEVGYLFLILSIREFRLVVVAVPALLLGLSTNCASSGAKAARRSSARSSLPRVGDSWPIPDRAPSWRPSTPPRPHRYFAVLDLRLPARPQTPSIPEAPPKTSGPAACRDDPADQPARNRAVARFRGRPTPVIGRCRPDQARGRRPPVADTATVARDPGVGTDPGDPGRGTCRGGRSRTQIMDTSMSRTPRRSGLRILWKLAATGCVIVVCGWLASAATWSNLNATATAGASFSAASDWVPPAGGSVAATGLGGTGSRYSTSTTLHLALAKGTDSGSGLATTGSQLLRATATLNSSDGIANGVCGSYAAFAQVGSNDPTSPATDTVPTNNRCYVYEYQVPDNAGNVATYTSPDIKVQTTAAPLTTSAIVITPVTGTSAQVVSGTSVTYQSAQSGSFTVQASLSDSESGVTQVVFPTIAGFTGGGAVTTPVSGTTYRTTYSWSNNGTSSSPGPQTITATDGAGLSQANGAAFSIVKAATATTHVLSLTAATGAYLSAGTLYYKPTVSGSFKLVDAFTASAGAASDTYPAIGVSGWTHNSRDGLDACGWPLTHRARSRGPRNPTARGPIPSAAWTPPATRAPPRSHSSATSPPHRAGRSPTPRA